MIFKTPLWLRKLFPTLIWSIPTEEKVLYLTFDDGPIPEITEWTLNELRKYNAKATFFCIGDNVRKYPSVFKKVLEEGHKVGNHTFNHLKGWSTNNNKYYQNIDKCSELVKSDLFRPPFGRIKTSQYKELQKNYKIIMWSILTWDFLKNLDQEWALKTTIEKTMRGDIIVFHDSVKAEHNLKFLLPKYLKYFSEKGFEFKSLPQ